MIIFGAHIILWVDFMVSNKDLNAVPSNSESFTQELMKYTTNAAFCVLFLPFWGLYKLFSRYMFKSMQYSTIYILIHADVDQI